MVHLRIGIKEPPESINLSRIFVHPAYLRASPSPENRGRTGGTSHGQSDVRDAFVSPHLVRMRMGETDRQTARAGLMGRRKAALVRRQAQAKTAVLQRRAEKAPPGASHIAWKAQKRLCGRYRHLAARGVPKNKVSTAIAGIIGFHVSHRLGAEAAG